MEAIESEILVYEQQLEQVQAAITATAPEPNDELSKLHSDLSELIKLSKQNLLELKKEALLKELDQHQQEPKDEPTKEEDAVEEHNHDLHQLEGNKCQAPHKSLNGVSYHNAIIFSVESDPR